MIKSFNVQELVEKEVVPFGNGSIVYTPKKWIGRKVTVVLQEEPFDIKGEAMEALKPYLGIVEGVFLFGSFARNEQTPESDVDVLVISSKKIALKKSGRMDFLVKTKQEFLGELKRDKTLFLRQALSEAKPVFNESLLSELKAAEGRLDFGEMLEDTLGAFKSVQELLDASKKQGLEYLDSNATVYSLMLRLRGLVSAQCLAKKQAYSSKRLAAVLKSRGFEGKKINGFLAVYRAERDNKKTAITVSVAEAEKLFEAAKTEFVKTEMLVKPWAKTNTKKR